MPVLVFLLLGAGTVQARGLSFEERVAAQEAIERVSYSHQIGAIRPFEDAAPRALLEKKVETYLKQSLVLDRLWKTPVTAEALKSELRRIERQSKLPQRLRELFAALHDDTFLVQECLARPALADRLSRSFFAADQRIHEDARHLADALRARLVSGALPLTSEDPRRTVVEIVRTQAPGRGHEPPHSNEAAEGEPPRSHPRNPWPWRALENEESEGQIGPPFSDGAGENRPLRPLGYDPAFFEGNEGIVARMAEDEAEDGARDEAEDGARDEAEDEIGGSTSRVPRLFLEADDFSRSRSRAPELRGEVGSVTDEGQAFVIRAMIAEDPRRCTIVTYSVPKISWDAWWQSLAGDLDARAVPPVASPTDVSMMDLARENRALSSDPCAPDDTWDGDGLYIPEGRGRHTAVWTGSLMIVWGGRNGGAGAVMNSGARYDPATDTWSRIALMGAPTARWYHKAVWTGSEMIVWGGLSSNGSQNTGGRYDPVADVWRPTSLVNAPLGRENHSLVWTGSRMIVWGGSAPFYLGLNSGGRYDPATDTWQPTSLLQAPGYRSKHVAVWTGSRMLVWGGEIDGQPVNAGSRYDPVSDTWSWMAVAGAPAARRDATAVWAGNRMIVWGGAGLNTGGRYDPSADTWSATSVLNAPEGREGHSVVWTGTVMIVWAGGFYTTNTGGRYNPQSNTWLPTSTANAPSARTEHTAVWTGSLMIVWGGAANTFTNNGGRYNPGTDSWTPTGPQGIAEARAYHTSVWTGNEIIVWGGANGQAPVNSGGRLDPTTMTWRATSTVNAPEGRSRAAAVWSEGRMIVWGGSSYDRYLNTGGRYDPIADAWSPTSTLNAPPGRSFLTMVAAGRLVLVWGGYNGSNSSLLGSGGRYDPSADAWLPISSVDAPRGRYGHTAIWTGRLMVLWGGYGGEGTGWLGDGARYDPVADLWTPTAAARAPSPRAYHTAVWTGREMIVWGGYFCCAPMNLDSGGRYDPAADAWSPTSVTAGVPAGRQFHTSVWTGQDMIVWGGRVYDYGVDHYVQFDTGGRYRPATNTWRPTGTGADDPEGRSDHTAQWTGHDMIVWGGVIGDQIVPSSSGSAYTANPDDDRDGISVCAGDCDDDDPAVHPGASEVCNGRDDSCDGGIDEGVRCDDGNACTEDACAGVEGCLHTALPDGAACSDGSACTTQDACRAGACAGGPPPDCNDGNTCTDDSCDAAAGCSNAPNSNPCDDDNACTVGDACAAGHCRPGRPLIPKVDCNDGNACTLDACDPESGCIHLPRLCRDDNRCTLDACDPRRGCVFTPRPGCEPKPVRPRAVRLS